MTTEFTRLAAYGVCTRDDRILLARYVSPDGSQRHWTLPGGRVEHAEDPYDAVVREIDEETGYRIRVDRLLGIDSRRQFVDWAGPDGGSMHRVAIFYAVRIVGGDLRHEVDGSTDLAAWVPMSEVADAARSTSVDVGLKLAAATPADGRAERVEVGGLVRY
ncbi:MAG TPA: NUDIX domain-containing protein [Nocardioidaceae bacterium]|nr:NUDIX domain-containing protein [Nocardioidaceae bacterium]